MGAEHESARVRVLLVDDDPAALATLAGVLEIVADLPDAPRSILITGYAEMLGGEAGARRA